MEFSYPLARRTLTTSMSWRRFLNSVDCGLESPPWKISSEVDDIEVNDGESGGGIIEPSRGDCSLVGEEWATVFETCLQA